MSQQASTSKLPPPSYVDDDIRKYRSLRGLWKQLQAEYSREQKNKNKDKKPEEVFEPDKQLALARNRTSKILPAEEIYRHHWTDDKYRVCHHYSEQDIQNDAEIP